MSILSLQMAKQVVDSLNTCATNGSTAVCNQLESLRGICGRKAGIRGLNFLSSQSSTFFLVPMISCSYFRHKSYRAEGF